MANPESQLWQFWWNWWVQFAVAVGTLAAALAAVFGRWLGARLFPPKLRLKLVPGPGVFTPITLRGPDGSTQDTVARYHHVEAFNAVSWPRATGAQVYLTRVESPRPDGQWGVIWADAIPLLWQYQEVQPLTRTLGPAYYCALCSVVKDKYLTLHPLTMPFSLPPHFAGSVDIVVTLEVRSDDGVSPERQFRISWDGKWHDGDQEMANHFVVGDFIR